MLIFAEVSVSFVIYDGRWITTSCITNNVSDVNSLIGIGFIYLFWLMCALNEFRHQSSNRATYLGYYLAHCDDCYGWSTGADNGV